MNEENLPIYSRQRDNLIEISVRGKRLLPPQRKQEIDDTVQILEERIAYVSECSGLNCLQPSRPDRSPPYGPGGNQSAGNGQFTHEWRWTGNHKSQSILPPIATSPSLSLTTLGQHTKIRIIDM